MSLEKFVNSGVENGKKEKKENVQSKKPDRTVTKWVRFVSSEKYVKKDAPSYVEYVCKPGWWVKGTVERIAEGTMKINGKQVKTDLFIVRTNDGTKYGFAIPHVRYYLAAIQGLPEEGKKVFVRYMGEISLMNSKTGTKLIYFEFKGDRGE